MSGVKRAGAQPGCARVQGTGGSREPVSAKTQPVLQGMRSACVIPVMEPAASSLCSRSGGQWGWGSSRGARAPAAAVSAGHRPSAAAVSQLKTIREGGEPGGRM